jgi:hypothetical protein
MVGDLNVTGALVGKKAADKDKAENADQVQVPVKVPCGKRTMLWMWAPGAAARGSLCSLEGDLLLPLPAPQ